MTFSRSLICLSLYSWCVGNTDYQFDRIWNHPNNTGYSWSNKGNENPSRYAYDLVNWSGKAHPNHGCHHPLGLSPNHGCHHSLGLSPGLHKRNKVENKMRTHSTLLPDCGHNMMSCLHLLPPWLPYCNRLHHDLWTRIIHGSWKSLCQGSLSQQLEKQLKQLLTERGKITQSIK